MGKEKSNHIVSITKYNQLALPGPTHFVSFALSQDMINNNKIIGKRKGVESKNDATKISSNLQYSSP